MKSDSGTNRFSVSSVPDDLLDEFDALADAEGKDRSEKVRELMRDAVGDSVADDSGDYLPNDEKLREVYEAAEEHANPHLTLRFDLVGSDIAQSAGIGKKAVRGHLFRLQKRGYVKHLHGDSAGSQSKESYRIKPPHANPKMWRYSEVYDPEAVRALEATEPEDAGDRLDDIDAAGTEVSQSAD